MIPIIRQNVDINARAKDFPAMAEDELLVSSSFLTIQGEGPFAGHRAWFIRLSGCNFGGKADNIACNFCDTDFRISRGQIKSFDALLTEYREADASRPLIVLTGGEPLLQVNALKFIEVLLKAGYVVQVETNGSFLLRASVLAATYKNFHIVCSPKQVGGRYPSAPPQFDYEGAINRVYFKFVVNSDPGSAHHALPTWVTAPQRYVHALFAVSPMTIYKKEYSGEVSSIWDRELVDVEAIADNYRYAAKLVMQDPRLTFTCQLHTLMAIA